MDTEQLKYKRIYSHYYDADLGYKDFKVTTNISGHIKCQIVHACCREHAYDLSWKPTCNIVSIKYQH